MADRYHGAVVFVEGVHYAVDKDGQANMKKPLRWDEDGYRAAEKNEPLHNDVHHTNDSELDVGGE